MACSVPATGVTAGCAEYDVNGDIERNFAERLLGERGLNAISVQRASAPVATP